VGQGAWTAFAQIAADSLGLELGQIELRAGSSHLPDAGIAGGSAHTATAGMAIHCAGADVIGKLTGNGAADPAAQGAYAIHAHGAVFAEVKVDPDLGQVRVSRLVGAFAAGTIINPRLVRSQC